jgi:hypothetical protein
VRLTIPSNPEPVSVKMDPPTVSRSTLGDTCCNCALFVAAPETRINKETLVTVESPELSVAFIVTVYAARVRYKPTATCRKYSYNQVYRN